MSANTKTAYRGAIFYFKDTATFKTLPKQKLNPAGHDQFVYIEDGLLIVENGKVVETGDYSILSKTLGDTPVVDYKGKLLTPGFIDTHNHSTQTGIVAAYGEKLLEWLDNYVFPAERTYKDEESARRDLNIFLDHLVMNGTTTACSYGPLFYDGANIFFEEIEKRQMKMITGNTMMDANSPDFLSLSTQDNIDNAKKLIDKWHNKGRSSFCLTPRFALSCSEELLEASGELKKEHPDLYVQTHLNENLNEIKAAGEMFSWSKSYLDIYDHYGLVDNRSIFGHCIHMTDSELERFKETQAIMAWCPLSNNFLGSGLFNLEKVLKYTEQVTLATDVGGGNCFSMLAVMDDAYKVALLQSYKVPSMVRWYLATLGSAKALQIDDKVGNFEKGKEADFLVIDPQASPLVKYRSEQVDDIFELLFILMTIGDDRNIKATYINGNCAYEDGKMKAGKPVNISIS